MGWLRKTLFRLQPLLLKEKIESELGEEIRSHLEMQTEANIAGGMEPEEARFAALRQFGGVDQVKERFRDERGFRWIEQAGADLRYAIRQLRHAPAFAITAVLTIAIGIGACAAIFSIVNGVLLRPLDFPHPERVVVVDETSSPKLSPIPATPGDYLDWRKQATAFEHLAALYYRSYNSSAEGNAISIAARCVTANYFSVLGVKPILGRPFLPEEGMAGKDRVIILSYRSWQSQFGGRATVIGETIRLDDQAFTIIGVLPRLATFDWKPYVVTPMAFSLSDQADHGSHFLTVIGRLKSVASVKQAQSEMEVISDRIARQHPDSNKGIGVRVTAMLEAGNSEVRLQLLVLLGAVGLLLVIACVNVASLLLARASARQKEISVRVALGATRGRIVRQFLCESLLLTTTGGTLGIMLAYASMGPLVRFSGHFVGRVDRIAVDGFVLSLACALMILAGLGIGLVPALQATRGNAVDSLKDSGRGSSGSREQQRARGALVVAEVALALILLAGTGLLARTLTEMQQANEGFEIGNVYSNRFSLSSGKIYDSPQRITAFVNRGLERISALPEVRSIAFTTGLPMGAMPRLLFTIPGRPKVPLSAMPFTDAYAITPDYFKVMSIPLARGREFTPQDASEAPRVIIINQEMAKTYFPGEDPIGQRIMVLTAANAPDVWREVVGIAGDVRPSGPQSAIGPQVYEPLAQRPDGNLILAVRARGPAPMLPAAIRDIFHSIDPNVPFDTIYPYYLTVQYSWVRQRFSMVLFAIFSGIALLLAAIGIYGVMAYSVSQRTNEIGIRMALGAQACNVFRLILGSGAKIVGLGLLIGVAGSIAFTRLLRSLLFNTSPHDPLTLLAVALVLALVAFVACWVPARRATKIDPMVALRSE